MDHRRTELPRFRCQDSDCLAIDSEGTSAVLLGLIHRSVCRWVDNERGAMRTEIRSNAGRIRQVEFRTQRCLDAAKALQRTNQLKAYLARITRDKDIAFSVHIRLCENFSLIQSRGRRILGSKQRLAH
ncbi:hypothetical protein WJ86_00530 [Burkholderia multivorans]|nr:hypothetical protein WJ86_00530 [Burkholderia multivorans]